MDIDTYNRLSEALAKFEAEYGPDTPAYVVEDFLYAFRYLLDEARPK